MFMQYCLVHVHDRRMCDAMGFVEHHGFNVLEESRFKGLVEKTPYVCPIGAWLGRFYPSILEKLYDKRPAREVFDLWRKTKAVDRGKAKRPTTSYDKKVLRASGLARQEYAKGWRANHDWNTVK